MRIKYFIPFCLLMCCYAISIAQERIVELSTNARVIQQNQDLNLGRTPNSSNQFWIYTPITIVMIIH